MWLFLAVPWVFLQFTIVVFPDHSHFLFYIIYLHYYINVSNSYKGSLTFLNRDVAFSTEITFLHRDVIWSIVMSLSYIKMSNSCKGLSYF